MGKLGPDTFTDASGNTHEVKRDVKVGDQEDDKEREGEDQEGRGSDRGRRELCDRVRSVMHGPRAEAAARVNMFGKPEQLAKLRAYLLNSNRVQSGRVSFRASFQCH